MAATQVQGMVGAVHSIQGGDSMTGRVVLVEMELDPWSPAQRWWHAWVLRVWSLVDACELWWGRSHTDRWLARQQMSDEWCAERL